MSINTPQNVSFNDRPTDNPDLFLFGWDPGNVILAGNDNSIVDCRRCTVLNGQNNSIGSAGRANGKYNTHIIGSNKTAQKNNILYIACSNGMDVIGNLISDNNSELIIDGDALIGDPSSGVGDVNVVGDVVGSNLSDSRLKTNKVLIQQSLKKINSINAVEFEWNDLQKTHKGKDIGLIAQQVKNISSVAVRKNKNGFYSVNYRKIIPILVAAIKEKQEKINQLNLKLKFINENI